MHHQAPKTPGLRVLLAFLSLLLLRLPGWGASFGNGSFEQPGVAGFQALPAGSSLISGWVVDAGGVAYASNEATHDVQPLDGQAAATFGNAGATGGQISQSFDTVPGTVYRVNYWFCQTDSDLFETQSMEVEAFAGANSLALAASNQIPSVRNQWSQGALYTFTATSTSTRLVFRDTTLAGDGLTANWALDAVVVTSGGSGKLVYQQYTDDFRNDPSLRGIRLILLDTQTEQPTVLAGSEFFSYGQAALSADGQRVAFVAQQGLGGPKLWVMKTEPIDSVLNPAVMLRPTVRALAGISWSPDGKRLAFVDDVDSQVYVLNVVDGAGAITPESPTNLPVKITTGAYFSANGLDSQAQNPAWSPDGKYLAYSNGTGLHALRILDDLGGLLTETPGTNVPVPLTSNLHLGENAPSWSPDGTKLVFSSTLTGPPGVPVQSDIAVRTVRQSLAGGGALIPAAQNGTDDNRVSLTRNPAGGFNPPYVIVEPNFVAHPTWSTDGSRVIYEYREDGTPSKERLFSSKPAYEDPVSNQPVELTPITTSSGAPGGRRPSGQPVAIVVQTPLPTPSDFVIQSGNPGEPWTFTVTLVSSAPNLSLRVQSTLTPGDSGSWVDLPVDAEMLQSGDTWSLETADLPLGTRYFRVVATATGFSASTLPFPNANAPTPFVISSPAGRILFTRGTPFSRELVIMEADGTGKTVLTDNTLSPQQCVLSPNGLLVAFTTFDGKLWLMKSQPMNGTTNVPVNVLEGSSAAASFGSSISWSPDGHRIIFLSSSHLYVLEAVDDGGEIAPFDDTLNPLIDVGVTFSSSPNPAWSPDGRYVALCGASVLTAIQIQDASGNITPLSPTNNPINLTNPAVTVGGDAPGTPSNMAYAAWSPDGQHLAIVEKKVDGTKARIAILAARDGSGNVTPETDSNKRQLLHAMTDAPLADTVSWSPDEALLAIGATAGGVSHVEVFRPETVDSTNPRVELTTQAQGGQAFGPSFQQPVVVGSGSGQLVAFEADHYEGNEDGGFINVRVLRTGITTGPLTVGFSVTGGTATEGVDLEDESADFVTSESPLVFAAGETVKQIQIFPINDGEAGEGDETIVLTLDQPDAGDLDEPSEATVVIHDNEGTDKPFTLPSDELAVSINGKLKKAGKAKTGDVWKFVARQTRDHRLNLLGLEIQASTTPKVEASWATLPEGTLGRANSTSFTWVATTTKVPTGKVYFRTLTTADSHRSTSGPVVGPFTIVPAPVLEMTVTAVSDSDPDAASVKPGEFITYTLKCKNVGTATAKKVVLNSRLPQRTRFDSASHNNGQFPGYFVLDTDKKGVVTDVFWNVGELAPNGEATEFVTVQVDQTVPYEWIIQNDRLTYKMTGLKEVFLPILRTDVTAPIRINVAKDKNIVVAGDQITYTLTLFNDASFTVTGGQVTDQIPAATRLVSCAHGDGNGNFLGVAMTPDLLGIVPDALNAPGFTAYNGLLTWNVGNIEAGGSRQLRFTVQVAYDIFEKISRNGESVNAEIQNFNFDFLATPPSGGIIAARGGVIPGSQIARSLLSQETPDHLPELGITKEPLTESMVNIGSERFSAIIDNGPRIIEYSINAWNHGDATAHGAIIHDGIPADTELSFGREMQAEPVSNAIVTYRPSGFQIGDKVIFTRLEGGDGLKTGKVYFVQFVLTNQAFTVSETSGGPAVDIKSFASAGSVQRSTYDFASFMDRFSINGTRLDSPLGFQFFDVNGNRLSAGGEPFVDHNQNGKIDKGDYLDENSNGKYDGPGAIRSFTYNVGDMPGDDDEIVLKYLVDVKSTVKRGSFIAACSAASHVRGEGLSLTTSDYFYPLDGSPTLVLTRVVGAVNFAGDAGEYPGTKFVVNDPLTHEKVCKINFSNTGDLYAIDTVLRVPIPRGYTTDSAPIKTASAKQDAVLTGSPGTAVFDIGVVAPGERVEREFKLKLATPALDKKGNLKDFDAPVIPRVFSTRASGTPPPTGFKRGLLAAAAAPFPTIGAAAAAGLPTMTFTMQKESNSDDTCVFIGRVAPATVAANTEMDIFIFAGNLGGKRSSEGEIGIQVPFGTRFLSADAIAYNGTEGGPNDTFEFEKGFLTVEKASGGRRPQDGTVDVIRWKFPNIAPSQLFVFRLRVFVNGDFGNKIQDRSCYIKCDGAHGRIASPLAVGVRHFASGTTDAWQSICNFMDEIGLGLEGAIRSLLGNHRGEVTIGSHVIGLGGADFVSLTNGQVIIPLGGNRAVILAPANVLESAVVPSSIVFRTGGPEQLALAGGSVSTQSLNVPNVGLRNVEDILSTLTSANSIVAAGGGNIVAAGGGNVVANDGAGIVAGGGGNFTPGAAARVNSASGTSCLVGSITFSQPDSSKLFFDKSGNIVAAGGGNIVAAGGGNIVAAGGGNLVAAGQGNEVVIEGKLIRADNMRAIINSLIGQDAAGLISNKGLNALLNSDLGAEVLAEALIGGDGASLVGQDAAQ